MKLHQKTPASFIFFMAGSLPLPAIIDLRVLGLFSMLSRLGDNILCKLARQILITSDKTQSWFVRVKRICLQYELPHPLSLLDSPLSKESFKALANRKVQVYWQEKLRVEASLLQSLSFFKPNFMSLSKIHPLIATCGTNPYEVNKSIIQLKMLSGRYRSDALLSHFHTSNLPQCQLSCDSPDAVGDLTHLLVQCSTLASRRIILFEYWEHLAASNPVCLDLIEKMKVAPPLTLTQFLIDCSVMPEVLSLIDSHGEHVLPTLFKMTRTFCYSIHRERLKHLNRWR